MVLPFNVISRRSNQKLFVQGIFFVQNSASKIANCYCTVVDVITGKLLATFFKFISLKYGVSIRA